MIPAVTSIQFMIPSLFNGATATITISSDFDFHMSINVISEGPGQNCVDASRATLAIPDDLPVAQRGPPWNLEVQVPDTTVVGLAPQFAIAALMSVDNLHILRPT